MKPLKKIMLLASAVSAIVLFWLVPGINTSHHVEYTRRFEDVDRQPIAGVADKTPSNRIKKIVPVYKSETIKPEMTLSKVTPKMFSRSMQFEEVLLYDSLTDKVLDHPIVEAEDSVHIELLDSLELADQKLAQQFE
jgi:hypothetical protein